PVNDAPVAKDYVAPAPINEDASPYVGELGGVGPTDIAIDDLATDVEDVLDADDFDFVDAIVGGVTMPLADAGISYDEIMDEFTFNPAVAVYQPLKDGEAVDVVVNFTV
ncbi:MAG TPA: hypothetical protein DDW52_21295, partial [Planctomycetaceae bacterium]|nr:hypothetical protein [Planctomycetaceae bacterium]